LDDADKVNEAEGKIKDERNIITQFLKERRQAALTFAVGQRVLKQFSGSSHQGRVTDKRFVRGNSNCFLYTITYNDQDEEVAPAAEFAQWAVDVQPHDVEELYEEELACVSRELADTLHTLGMFYQEIDNHVAAAGCFQYELSVLKPVFTNFKTLACFAISCAKKLNGDFLLNWHTKLGRLNNQLRHSVGYNSADC
jgi:hypothetical protein